MVPWYVTLAMFSLGFVLGLAAALAWANRILQDALRKGRAPETESNRYIRESGGYGLSL